MKPNYRRCVSCRKVALKEEFWRIVRLSSPQAHTSSLVELDQGMGRSVYLCPQATCLKLAQKKDRLGRALKAPVADQLYHTLWQRLSSDQARHQPEQTLQ
ncbi:MAG: YlxR family protein [Tildeniella nuda ZEHNDER 1965/U140]|nr:YlxR family protein [Tildeniella nuda ZEHNDER 1965/U140]